MYSSPRCMPMTTMVGNPTQTGLCGRATDLLPRRRYAATTKTVAVGSCRAVCRYGFLAAPGPYPHTVGTAAARTAMPRYCGGNEQERNERIERRGQRRNAGAQARHALYAPL